MAERYPGYDVMAKWDSVSFDDKTRHVLGRRLHQIPERRFFTEAEFATLTAAAELIAPRPERGPQPPIAPWIDAMLHEGATEGFRFEHMPPEAEAWRTGLAALDAEAQMAYVRSFAELDPESRTVLLKRVQNGEVDATRWSGLDPKTFFVNLLLREISGVYYAHPQAWSEMGFGGPASPRGYVRMGLNEHDPWEAREAAARR